MVICEHFEAVFDIKIKDMFYSTITTSTEEYNKNGIYNPFCHFLNSPLSVKFQEEITKTIIRKRQNIRIISEDLVEITEETIVYDLIKSSNETSQYKDSDSEIEDKEENKNSDLDIEDMEKNKEFKSLRKEKRIIFVGEIETLLPNLHIFINNIRTPLLRKNIVWNVYKDDIIEEYRQILFAMSNIAFFFSVLSSFVTVLGEDVEFETYKFIPTYMEKYYEVYQTDIDEFLKRFCEYLYSIQKRELIRIDLKNFQKIYDNHLQYIFNKLLPKFDIIRLQKINEIAEDLTDREEGDTYADTFLRSKTFNEAITSQDISALKTKEKIEEEIKKLSNQFHYLLKQDRIHPLYVECPPEINTKITLIATKYVAGIIKSVGLKKRLKSIFAKRELRKRLELKYDKIVNDHEPKTYVSIQSDRNHKIKTIPINKRLKKKKISKSQESFYDIVRLNHLVEKVESREYQKIQFEDHKSKSEIIELLSNKRDIYATSEEGFEADLKLGMPVWKSRWAWSIQLIGFLFLAGYIFLGYRYIKYLQWDMSYTSLISGLFFITGIMIGGRYFTIKEDQSVSDCLNFLFIVNILWPTFFIIIGFILTFIMN